MTEALKTKTNPEVSLYEPEAGIAGTLKDPLVQPIGEDQMKISYHWEAPDDKHTYLHIVLRKSPEDSFAVASANLDSADIRGQGEALWRFAAGQFQDISNHGGFPVHHEGNVNDYSRHLFEADPRYHQVGESKYFGIYSPEAQESTLKRYPSKRV